MIDINRMNLARILQSHRTAIDYLLLQPIRLRSQSRRASLRHAHQRPRSQG